MNMVVDREALQEAIDWLRKSLADGPVMAEDIKKMATEAGISQYRISQAAREIGIQYEREAVYQGKTYYRLPKPGAAPKRQERQERPERTKVEPAIQAEPDEIDETLLEIVQPLRSVLDQLQAQRSAVQDQLRTIQDKERRVQRTLMNLDPDGWNRNLSGKTPERKPKEPSVSPQRLDTIVAFMHQNDRDLTVTEIAKACGYSEPHTYEAIRALRQNGLVRLTGRNGGASQTARTFRLDPQVMAATTPDPTPAPEESAPAQEPEWEPQSE